MSAAPKFSQNQNTNPNLQGKIYYHSYNQNDLNLPLASRTLRFLAYLIDGALIGGVSIIISSIFVKFGFSKIEIMVFNSIVSGLYYVYFISQTGQTIGKKLLKIKVINDSSNDVLTLNQAFMREIVGKFLSIVTFFIGFAMILFSSSKKGLHDHIGKSKVVSLNDN